MTSPEVLPDSTEHPDLSSYVWLDTNEEPVMVPQSKVFDAAIRAAAMAMSTKELNILSPEDATGETGHKIALLLLDNTSVGYETVGAEMGYESQIAVRRALQKVYDNLKENTRLQDALGVAFKEYTTLILTPAVEEEIVTQPSEIESADDPVSEQEAEPVIADAMDINQASDEIIEIDDTDETIEDPECLPALPRPSRKQKPKQTKQPKPLRFTFRFGSSLIDVKIKGKDYPTIDPMHQLAFGLGLAVTFAKSEEEKFEFLKRLLNKGKNEGKQFSDQEVRALIQGALLADICEQNGHGLQLGKGASEIFELDAYQGTLKW